MNKDKKDWILLLLNYSPLDRIHIMKALFLIWHRAGRNIPNYFTFEPYLYGPCSFEVYSILDNMESEGLVLQPPHPVPQWVNFYLTENGRNEVKELSNKFSKEELKLIEEVVKEISKLGFYELLKKVYSEAPDFAINSMFRGVIK